MDLFHGGHLGASTMKNLARSYIWWPGMNRDLENRVKECEACQRACNQPPISLLMPWESPQASWERLHGDFAGPYEGKIIFILVDAYSKWLKVVLMSADTSTATIECIRASLATHGLPKAYMENNGIFAEHSVQSFKRALEKNKDGSISTRVARFLFSFRRTPHSTTGLAPAELLLGRIP